MAVKNREARDGERAATILRISRSYHVEKSAGDTTRKTEVNTVPGATEKRDSVDETRYISLDAM